MAEKLIPEPFPKNQNWAYLWINSLKFNTVGFHCIPSWGISKYIEAKPQVNCFHLIQRFLKKQRGLELVSLPYFLHDFWEKIILFLYSINWQNFIVWLPLLSEMLGKICTVVVCQPGCDVINFVINVMFLIKPFFSTWLKSWDKTLNILITKRAFQIK